MTSGHVQVPILVISIMDAYSAKHSMALSIKNIIHNLTTTTSADEYNLQYLHWLSREYLAESSGVIQGLDTLLHTSRQSVQFRRTGGCVGVESAYKKTSHF